MIKLNQHKLNIVTVTKVAFIAALLYSTAVVLARCT